jgi:hypothetical protein
MGSLLVPSPLLGNSALLGSLTVGGAASYTFSGISTAYRNLQVVIRNFYPSADGATLGFRFNADATANRHLSISTNGADGDAAHNATGVIISRAADNTVVSSLITIDIPDYANATIWKRGDVRSSVNNYLTTTSVGYMNLVARYNQTAAVTSLQFYASTGNISGMTVLIYGVN